VALVRVYCGLASADESVRAGSPAQLTIAVVDDAGRLLGVHEISDDPDGYAELGMLLVERTSGFTDAAVAADSDDHLVTSLLTAAGRPLVVTDDDTTDDYAERFADDDSIDEMQAPPAARRAVGLARALQAGAIAAVNLPAPRELVSYKPVLAAHVAMLGGRQAAAVALREVLRELYPAALRAYPDPAHPLALAVLDSLPEPGRLTVGGDSERVAEQIAAELIRAGAGTDDEVIAAVTALHVAISESPRRGGVNKSLAPAAAETVRKAISAVRSCDGACAALIGTIAARSYPATGGLPRRRSGEPAPLQAVSSSMSQQSPADAGRAARRTRREPAATGSGPVRPHPMTAPPVAPDPIAPPPLAPRPMTHPPAAPAASASPAFPNRAPAGPSNSPVSVPPPPPGMTPITPGSRPFPASRNPGSAPSSPVAPAASLSPGARPSSPSSRPSSSLPSRPASSLPSRPSSSLPSRPASSMPSSARPSSAPPPGSYASGSFGSDSPGSDPFAPDSYGPGSPSSGSFGSGSPSGGSFGGGSPSGGSFGGGSPSSGSSSGSYGSGSARSGSFTPDSTSSGSFGPGSPSSGSFGSGSSGAPSSGSPAPGTFGSRSSSGTVPPGSLPPASVSPAENGQPFRATLTNAAINNARAERQRTVIPPRPSRGQPSPAAPAPAGGSATDYSLPVQAQRPEPGSRANWPLLNSGSDENGLPAASSSAPPLDNGRVKPPWQDMPKEPPSLRLVESQLDTTVTNMPAVGDPPPLRVIDGDDRGNRRSMPRRNPGSTTSSSTTLTALDRSTTPPVPSDSSDGDLLIFAAARSAWFTGHDEDAAADMDWSNPNDSGWRAAERAATPAIAAETSAGLPKRVPQANLVPGSPLRDERPLRIVRDAASIAAHTTGYFRGWRRGQEIGGFAMGGRPGRESAGGWDFTRDGQGADADGYQDNNAGYSTR
jgi:hypothetical protein